MLIDTLTASDKTPFFLSKEAWCLKIQCRFFLLSGLLGHILKPEQCVSWWKWAWYFQLKSSKSKHCHCVPGVDGGPGSPLSLQHTLLLPGAGQRGGGGGRECSFTCTTKSFTTGSCSLRNQPGRVWDLAVVPFLLTCCLSCPTPDGGGQPEETGRGGYSFPVHPEKWWTGRK